TMDDSEKSLQDPTVTHELFQLISKMSDDERRTLLKLLKDGLLKGKCRRQHFRKTLHVPIHYNTKGGTFRDFIQNISLGGLFLLSRRTFSVGQRVEIPFFPLSIGETVWVTGDVVRVTEQGIAVKFRSTDATQKTAIMSLASTSGYFQSGSKKVSHR
ncbi:MAG: PilZ domain-containing protein, partial [Deltaproteobacteria bacterium]